METIVLKSIYHRGGQCIAMYCKPERVFVKIFKDILKAMWSKTNTAWYLESSKENYDKIIKAFRNVAIINDQRLEEFKKTDKESSSIFSDNFREKKQTTYTPLSEMSARLTDENYYAYKKFIQQLELKGYSKSTIRTYSSEFIQLLNVLKNYPAESLSVDRIKDYLHYCVKDLKLSEATIHSRINALKFYYEQVLNRDHFFLEIPRPKKRLQIPKVVSKEQIAILINSIENTKHKTIIMLAYACGLRVSEVVSLRVRNIDSDRKLLIVEQGKGKKDRVVSLGPGMLIMLRNYYSIYKPVNYLFEGQYKSEHLTARSIQKVLQDAKKKSGITQAGNMHMLRHSFATHLLDKGIDVVFIQKLLGHNDIKTTLKYLHVTNKDLIHIISPLEDIEGLLKK